MGVIASTEKVLPKILFRTNESYIIDSGNIGTQKAEYIIRHHIESDTGSTLLSSCIEFYVSPAKYQRTFSPGKN